MSQIVSIGLFVEGTTDVRFLGSIIRRTFEQIAQECPKDVEVFEPIVLDKPGGGFVADVLTLADQAARQGLFVLCVHADADAADDAPTHTYKIKPALEALAAVVPPVRTVVVPVVPVQMTEAWMLADKELLKDEIGTTESDQTLGLHRPPEASSNPKTDLEEAIRRVQAHLPRRRRDAIQLGQLYRPIGQKIPLSQLRRLPSYLKFEEAVRQAYRQLGYLPPR